MMMIEYDLAFIIEIRYTQAANNAHVLHIGYQQWLAFSAHAVVGAEGKSRIEGGCTLFFHLTRMMQSDRQVELDQINLLIVAHSRRVAIDVHVSPDVTRHCCTKMANKSLASLRNSLSITMPGHHIFHLENATLTI